MEMPMQVIIVLFVALVVGGAIIAFSKTTLNHAQAGLDDQFRKDPANKDVVVNVDTATAQTVVTLADTCVQQHKDSVDTTMCFALFADSFDIPDWSTLQGTEVSNGFTIDTSGVKDSATAVRITYSPTGKIIIS